MDDVLQFEEFEEFVEMDGIPESVPQFRKLSTPKVLLLLGTAVLVILVAIRNLVAWGSSQRAAASAPYYSLVAPAEALGESEIHRSRLAEHELVEVFDVNVTTLYENFQRSVQRYGSSPFLGARVGEGPFMWQTYGEVEKKTTSIGSALLHSGQAPGDLVGISARNRVEWVTVQEACHAYSQVCVAVYNTFNFAAKVHIIKECEMRVLFIDGALLSDFLEVAKQCPDLKEIVTFDPVTEQQKKLLASMATQVTVTEFRDFEARGKASPLPHIPPHPEEVATICYTSGTTGPPKGVMLSHANLIADGAGAIVSGNIDLRHSDVHLSYLPLAHTFERMVTLLLVSAGAQIGFYRGDIRKHLFADIQELKPTIFPSVPKLFNRIHDGVIQTVTAYPAWKKKLFEVAYSTKMQKLRQGVYVHYIWDALVFNKIRAVLGGRVRMMLIGSAPILPSVLDFMRVCFSCEVFEGYGQTECCAAACCSVPGTVTYGNVGAPLPCAEVKLVDIPKLNYRSTDEPYARGEICVRGPIVCKGYYKRPSLSPIDSRGWLHTGDVGMWLDDGTLKVIDRVNHIFKMAQGEFVAPERVENVMVQSQFVSMAFVTGCSLRSFLVCIVVVDPARTLQWAKDTSLGTTSVSELCKRDDLKAAILEDVADLCAKHGVRISALLTLESILTDIQLAGFEVPKAIFLQEAMFTPESGLLSPTFKIKRIAFAEHYKKVIQDMYMQKPSSRGRGRSRGS